MHSEGKRLNEEVLGFFVSHYARGRVALVGATDFVSEAVRAGQKTLTRDGKPSLWSHVFIMGEVRPDRRGPGASMGRSPYIFESDLQIEPQRLQLRNGVQENWIGKWCHDLVEHSAVLDLSLTEHEQDIVLGTALQLCDEQIQYPILELVGTWLAIVTRRLWAANPFDDPHAMYCSSFVRHCYREAGRDFLDQNISVSNTAPEHIAQSGPFVAEWHR
jgi:hypothetical protein